jgi:small subunit ribosomal protein S9
MDRICTVGRRKRAIARVYLEEGKGNITINDRKFEEYFPIEQIRTIVKQPLTVTEALGKYDIDVNLVGGGYKGQAEALRLGIARALVKVNADNKSLLKASGLLTRDSRRVERKKPGRPKARKRFQFSKR